MMGPDIVGGNLQTELWGGEKQGPGHRISREGKGFAQAGSAGDTEE